MCFGSTSICFHMLGCGCAYLTSLAKSNCVSLKKKETLSCRNGKTWNSAPNLSFLHSISPLYVLNKFV